MTQRPDMPSGRQSAHETALKHDRERYFCMLFAPAAARPALMTLLAFNHELGSIAEKVSEPIVGQIRLAWWHEAMEAIDGDRIQGHPLMAELAAACHEGVLEPGLLGELVAAREAEFTDPPDGDLKAIVDYARRTSGALHRAMMMAIDRDVENHLLEAAEAAGTAWGLVGALRSLPFHLQGGGGPFAALARSARPRLREVSEEISGRARQHIGQLGDNFGFDRRDRMAPLLPAAMADDYLRRLEKANFDPLEARFDRGHLRRRLAALLAWGRGRI